MADEIHNDNEPLSLRGPDAHGEAALLLVESLLHALTERAILTVADAVDIVETAADVNGEATEELGRPVARHTSMALLEAISSSLRYDL